MAFTSPHTRHNACSHPHLMDEERERASFALDTSWSLRCPNHQQTHPTTVCQATLGWVTAVPVIAWFPVFGRPSKDSVQPPQMHDLLARCPPSESGRSSATWPQFRTNQDWVTIASPQIYMQKLFSNCMLSSVITQVWQLLKATNASEDIWRRTLMGTFWVLPLCLAGSLTCLVDANQQGLTTVLITGNKSFVHAKHPLSRQIMVK